MSESIAKDIIYSLEHDPNNWNFDAYSATHGSFSVWIANRPYADLTFRGHRIGNWFQRRRIRYLMDKVMFERLEKHNGK